MAAAQGMEFRRPACSSDTLEAVVAAIRERVPPYDRDRFLAPEIAAVKDLVQSGAFLGRVPPEVRLIA